MIYQRKRDKLTARVLSEREGRVLFYVSWRERKRNYSNLLVRPSAKFHAEYEAVA